MSPIMIKRSIRGLLSIMALLALSACGDSNNSSFSRDTGGHPENWVISGHKSKVLASGNEQCKSCHGRDFLGGITQIACFGANGCHVDNVESVHPLAWSSTITLHGPYASTNGIESCSNIHCHGESWEGVQGSGFACTLCHN